MGFITTRDIELFNFLHESKVATTEQIRQRIFKDRNEQIAFRRLRMLAKAGFVERLGYSDKGILKSIYSLTEMAFDKHVRNEEMNDRVVQLKSGVPAHDLTLVDIRRRLERLAPTRKFHTENMLQSSFETIEDERLKEFVYLRSDAVIEVFLNEHLFAVPVEYEASVKSIERSRTMLLDYYTKSFTKAVLMICKDHLIRNRMVKSDKEVRQEEKSKLYTALLADVLADTPKVTFVSADKGREITL